MMNFKSSRLATGAALLALGGCSLNSTRMFEKPEGEEAIVTLSDTEFSIQLEKRLPSLGREIDHTGFTSNSGKTVIPVYEGFVMKEVDGTLHWINRDYGCEYAVCSSGARGLGEVIQDTLTTKDRLVTLLNSSEVETLAQGERFDGSNFIGFRSDYLFEDATCLNANPSDATKIGDLWMSILHVPLSNTKEAYHNVIISVERQDFSIPECRRIADSILNNVAVR